MDPINYAKVVARFLIHGTITSLILIVIIVVFPYFYAALSSDLLLLVTTLFLSSFTLVLIGIINVSTTEHLWKMETSKHWLSLLCHGFLLSLGSLLIWLCSMLFIAIALTTHPIISIVGVVPIIILFVFVNGYYGKGLANYMTHIGSLLL